MSLIYPMKFKTWHTGRFKFPHLQSPCFQMGGLSAVVSGLGVATSGTTSLTNFFTIRWADRISMRVELYGCEYIPDVLHFNGQSMIKRDMSSHPVASLRDTLRLRFKTNHENGVLFYSKGSQGDYMALQLVENR